MPPKQNQKAVAAKERQAKLQEERARQKAAEDEHREEQEWKQGANMRAERRQAANQALACVFVFKTMEKSSRE
jgi:hypothetical protein